MTKYSFMKLREKVKDPISGTGQGDETVVLIAADATTGKVVRHIEREGDTVTVTAASGAHAGKRISFPWSVVRWAREIEAPVAQAKAKAP